jgi:hypothetical protein
MWTIEKRAVKPLEELLFYDNTEWNLWFDEDAEKNCCPTGSVEAFVSLLH